MRMRLLPQANSVDVVSYSSNDDVLSVTLNGVTDYFDFSGLPDGSVSDFESETLDQCPVVSAAVVDGEVHVTAISFYDDDIPVRSADESAVNYAERLAAWEVLTKEREVTL